MHSSIFEQPVVKGIEIISFSNAALEKIREDSSRSMAVFGDLHVIYFNSHDLFLLQLNNWKYALLPALSTSCLREFGTGCYIYTLPTSDGTYLIRLQRTTNNIAIKNLETILDNTTNFRCPKSCYDVLQGDRMPQSDKKGHYSPKIVPQQEENFQNLNNALSFSGKQRKVNFQILDKKREKLKKKFRKIVKSISLKFKDPKENINLSYIRTFEGMKLTTKEMAPKHKFYKKEVILFLCFVSNI